LIMAKKIQIVIMDGAPVNGVLRGWAEKVGGFAYATHISAKTYPDLVAMWRNRICDWFLAMTDCSHLLLIDADMVPLPESDDLLATDADVAGAMYIDPNGGIAHEGEGNLGCGALRISRHALETIPRPWFHFELTDNGTAQAACECLWFCRRAQAAGFRPIRVGRFGHIVDTVVVPINQDSFKFKLLSDFSGLPRPDKSSPLDI